MARGPIPLLFKPASSLLTREWEIPLPCPLLYLPYGSGYGSATETHLGGKNHLTREGGHGPAAAAGQYLPTAAKNGGRTAAHASWAARRVAAAYAAACLTCSRSSTRISFTKVDTVLRLPVNE
eukprot:EG_transcript_42713